MQNISNFDEQRNTGLEPNESHIYNADQIALSERHGYSLLDIRSNTKCLLTASGSLVKLAKDCKFLSLKKYV